MGIMKLIPDIRDGSSFSMNIQTGQLARKMAWAPIRSSRMADDKRKVELIDLSKDRDASAARLEELKANRHVDDIPLDDEYWKALRKHRKAFK
jgi:hypothetical protein